MAPERPALPCAHPLCGDHSQTVLLNSGLPTSFPTVSQCPQPHSLPPQPGLVRRRAGGGDPGVRGTIRAVSKPLLHGLELGGQLSGPHAKQSAKNNAPMHLRARTAVRGGAEQCWELGTLHSRWPEGNAESTARGTGGGGSRLKVRKAVFPQGELSFLSFRGQRIISVTLKRSPWGQAWAGKIPGQRRCLPGPQGPKAAGCSAARSAPAGQAAALREGVQVPGPSSQQEARAQNLYSIN